MSKIGERFTAAIRRQDFVEASRLRKLFKEEKEKIKEYKKWRHGEKADAVVSKTTEEIREGSNPSAATFKKGYILQDITSYKSEKNEYLIFDYPLGTFNSSWCDIAIMEKRGPRLRNFYKTGQRVLYNDAYLATCRIISKNAVFSDPPNHPLTHIFK